jgi:hypothetical protein
MLQVAFIEMPWLQVLHHMVRKAYRPLVAKCRGSCTFRAHSLADQHRQLNAVNSDHPQVNNATAEIHTQCQAFHGHQQGTRSYLEACHPVRPVNPWLSLQKMATPSRHQ